jgi:uncharacterized protein (DUF1697 family)
MSAYVALLRGINVGGNNILPMAEFRNILAKAGCENVATYIQSGNAVFRHPASGKALSESIAKAIETNFGFRPSVMVVKANDFVAIAAANPFADENVEAKHVHISFLSEAAKSADQSRMGELAANGEKFVLTDRAFYMLAPNGIGRSKLAAVVEKCLGVRATGRNWRTVGKIGELISKLA